MARRLVTPEEAERVRRYGRIRVLRDGRVRFFADPGSDPALQFSVQRHHMEPSGVWVYDSARYGISAWQHGESSLMLTVRGSRVVSACFDFTLDPASLRHALAALREFGNGVERWLVPALLLTQHSLTRLESNPALLRVIPGLLKSVRDLPGAGEWKRRFRESEQAWKRWREENPTGTPAAKPRARRR